MLITERQLKTVLACPRLYELGGSINNYDKSQKLVRFSLNKLIANLLKDEVQDIDLELNSIVSFYIKQIYNTEELEPDFIIRLKKYAFSFLNKYIEIFNPKKYVLINGPSLPIVDFGEHKLRLSIDAIYKPKNRKRHLHAVCFVPFVDQHNISSDITLRIKADHLKTFASNSMGFSDFSSVNIHLVGCFKFHIYKSKTNEFRFIYKHLKYEDINTFDMENYISRFNLSIEHNEPIPFCTFYKCNKRKDCLK